VADTRQGLIAEVITLFAGLGGVGLLLYGLVPHRQGSPSQPKPPGKIVAGPRIRSATDLVIGSAGLVVAAALLAGLEVSAGWQWALMGAALLTPMVIGCGYLCVAFIRAPEREWKIDLRRLTGHR
jgi:hypothetical protein